MNHQANNLQQRGARNNRRAFTLLELILAIGLAAVLFALMGMAISLYLSRVDMDRSRVEEAQLARSVLAMIADDIRAASIYKPQDTSAIAQMISASAPFDVDSIDSAQPASGIGKPGGAAAVAKVASLSSSSTSSNSGALDNSSAEESDDSMPLGLSGTMEELFVDVTKLPRADELFATVTGYTNVEPPVSSNFSGMGASNNATADDLNPPADLKTVHYFVRTEAGRLPTSSENTAFAPNAPVYANGLIREEISRPMRVFAEQSGKTTALESNGVLVAPEVVGMELRYFDGSELSDTWDMQEMQKLPVAIEIKIWLQSARASESELGTGTEEASNVSLASANEYRQVVHLPMASQSQSGSTAAGGSSAQSSSSSSSSSASTSSSTSSESSTSSTQSSSSGGSVFSN